MYERLTIFLKDECGAITVDWVVLTAAVVGLGIAVVVSVGEGATDYAGGLNGHLQSGQVTTTY